MRSPTRHTTFSAAQRIVGVFLVAAILTTPVAAFARTLEKLPAIQREVRIVADVINSSLRSEMRDGVRVSSVTSEYLAKQGVLVSVRLNAPWLTINDHDSAVEINGQINLDEIPAMVENILADLNIDVSPYEPEALEMLRSLRTEQRQLREEQREVRAKLRENRRALVRATEDEDRENIQAEISQLELELTEVGVQYDDLAVEIDAQYQDLRDYRGGQSTPTPPTQEQNYDLLIARTACDYGATLRSLSSEDYFNVALRRNETSTYYAFKMDHVNSCNKGDMRVERLLELAYRYEG